VTIAHTEQTTLSSVYKLRVFSTEKWKSLEFVLNITKNEFEEGYVCISANVELECKSQTVNIETIVETENCVISVKEYSFYRRRHRKSTTQMKE
jgi:acetolactate synthase regulatory subunit